MSQGEWINEPPIAKVSKDQVRAKVKSLLRAVKEWQDSTPGRAWEPKKPSFLDRLNIIKMMNLKKQRDQAKEVHENWQTRLKNAHDLLYVDKNWHGGDVYEYVVSGVVVGLMMIEQRGNAPHIESVVAHPGQSGCGGIMIEYALNLTPDRPVLYLHAGNETAYEVWKALGFTGGGGDKPGNEMKLDARRSDKWVNVGGTWKRKKYVGSQYRASAGAA